MADDDDNLNDLPAAANEQDAVASKVILEYLRQEMERSTVERLALTQEVANLRQENERLQQEIARLQLTVDARLQQENERLQQENERLQKYAPDNNEESNAPENEEIDFDKLLESWNAHEINWANGLIDMAGTAGMTMADLLTHVVSKEHGSSYDSDSTINKSKKLTILSILKRDRNAYDECKDRGVYLLINACKSGRSGRGGMIEAFLEAVPASVWDRDEKDNTALHWLVSSGEPPAGSVPFLIGKYRAACSCANNTGELPAHIACRNKAVDPEVFYVLLKNSGLKDKKDQDRLAKLLEVTRNKTESNPRKDASKQTTHMNNLQEKQEMLTTFFIQLNRR